MQCCLGLNLDNISEMFKTKLEEIQTLHISIDTMSLSFQYYVVSIH